MEAKSGATGPHGNGSRLRIGAIVRILAALAGFSRFRKAGLGRVQMVLEEAVGDGERHPVALGPRPVGASALSCPDARVAHIFGKAMQGAELGTPPGETKWR